MTPSPATVVSVIADCSLAFPEEMNENNPDLAAIAIEADAVAAATSANKIH